MFNFLSFSKSRFALFLVLSISILFVHCKFGPKIPNEADYEIIQSAKGEKAMVVSAHHLATKIGNDILKQGGNAIDATIAVQYALAVVYPRAGNIGGGGFMVIRTKDGKYDSINI